MLAATDLGRKFGVKGKDARLPSVEGGGNFS